jgi:hypothetical protein
MSQTSDHDKLDAIDNKVGILDNEIKNLKRSFYKCKEECPFESFEMKVKSDIEDSEDRVLEQLKSHKSNFGKLVVLLVTLGMSLLTFLGTIQVQKLPTADFKDFLGKYEEANIRRDIQIEKTYQKQVEIQSELLREMSELKINVAKIVTALDIYEEKQNKKSLQ